MQDDTTEIATKAQSDKKKALEDVIKAAMNIMDDDYRESVLESLEGLAGPLNLLNFVKEKEEITKEDKARHQKEDVQARDDMPEREIFSEKVQDREIGHAVKCMKGTVTVLGFVAGEATEFIKAGEKFLGYAIGEDGKLNLDHNRQFEAAAIEFITSKEKLIEKIKGSREGSELNKEEVQKITALNKMCMHAEKVVTKSLGKAEIGQIGESHKHPGAQ